MNYYNIENLVTSNSYYCYQGTTLRCKYKSFTENLLLTLYTQYDEAKYFYENDRTTYALQNYSCFNTTKSYGILFKALSKELPVKKFCARKKEENSDSVKLNLGIGGFICRSFINYLFSTNALLVDNNPDSCTNDTKLNKISILKVTKSSMEVVIQFKINEQEPNCNDVLIFKHEEESCNAEDKVLCPLITFKVSDFLPVKMCKYFCPIGRINQLSILKNPLVWSPYLEICEIRTSLYDTSLEKNNGDYI